MANNKVQLSDGTVLLDLTGDTVTPEKLMAGVTAHDAAGNRIVGTGGGTGGGVNVSYDTIDPNRYSVNLDNRTAQLDLTGLVSGNHYVCNMLFQGMALDSQNIESAEKTINYTITVFSTGSEQYDGIICLFEDGMGDAPVQYNSALVLNLDLLLETTKNDYNYGMAYNITEMIQSAIVSWD